MRKAGLTFALLLVAACEDPKPAPGAASAAATASAAPTAAATATAAPTSAAAAKRPMPPRPFPVGSSGPVQPSAPPDQQMMAIQYTIAMVSPQGTDPLVDRPWVESAIKKMETAVRAADKGRTPPSPVKEMNGGRKLYADMGKGCTEKVPSSLVGGRGAGLKTAFDAGVLVVACRDDKWECHQSTRDPDDVLCLAAPRASR